MSRSTKEEAEQTRRRIMQAARDVFHEKGLTRATLLDVAERAGVTRGAIYWHFKNKEDLFEAMVNEVRLPLEAALAASALADGSDPLAQLHNWCTGVLYDLVRNPSTRQLVEIMVFKCEMAAVNGIADRKRACFRETREVLGSTIQRAIDAGQLSARLNVPLAVAVVHALVYGVTTHWVIAPEALDLDKHVERVADQCVGMLRFSPALLDPSE